MTPPWGINWQRYHADRQDMPHIEAMGYRSFTLYEWMWSDRDFVNELLSVARNDAIFLARDHPLSEQADQRFINDPAGKGRAHADEWSAKVQDGLIYTPLDRTFFLGLNEPDSNHYPRQIDAYNEAFCRRMAEHGLRVAAYSFGVGHPATVDLKPSTLPDWSHYQASALAIREGSHIVAVHEYGAPDGYGWGHWCNRIQHCPYEVDVIFDECGVDNGVIDPGELYGFAKFMSPDEYLQWLDGFQRGMAERAHTRKVNILAYNIFGYDHGSGENKDWHSFDIRPLRGKIEHFEWSQAVVSDKSPDPIHNDDSVSQDDHKTRLPNVQSGNPQPTAAPEQPVVIPSDSEMEIRPMILDPLVMEAILAIESGGRAFGPDGRLLIRFEAHIYARHAGQREKTEDHFRWGTDERPWEAQMFRSGDNPEWRVIHTGDQATEWEAFEVALALDPPAARQAISMGAPQIMGFNHARIGYPDAKTMFDAFQRSEHAQIIGLVNYMLSDPQLTSAIQQRDWLTMATLYNGSGAAKHYAGLLKAKYEAL